MSGFSNITAVILTGGLGTRIRSLVSDRPKVLAEIVGRPFLTFLLDQLASVGARKAVLCTGYMAEMIQVKLGDGYKSLRLTYSKEQEPLGTGGALRLALPRLQSDPVMVMNGDSYANVDLHAFLEWFLKKDSTVGILLTKVKDTSRYGKVVAAEDGRIESFEEKGGNHEPGWINAGIYLMKKKLVAAIPAEKPYSLEREFFPGLIGKGLYGFRSETEFIDIGTPESFSRAEAFMSRVCG